MKEFFITNDGVRLHAKLDEPEGARRLALVFHGLTGHMEERHIVAVAQALNEVGVATLRVELYGHGQSDGDFAEHTLYKWITGALAVMDYAKELGYEQGFYVTGHSQGGLLSMLLAALRPDDVRALMPLSPAIVLIDAARTGNLFGITFDPRHVPDRLEMPGGRCINGNYLRVARTLHVDEAIDDYEGPVLLVHGTADEAVPVHYSVDAAERYAHAKLVLVDGDDHGYHQHLNQVLDAIKAFVTELG